MKYLSVCSGIEAATVAWHGLGWKAAAYSEIEPFPSAVLAHHYPDVPNLGDMNNFKEWNIEPGSIDLLVGGTPCQSFSVAGLRKGLDDPRGNLMLTYLAIARQYRPRWLVWENVPGVLSSNGGLDFASLLRGMGECGYGFAYRILDAQYFGVPQRRRRVFVVGYLGDWRAAAAVLFERHSLQGNPAPSREKGKVSASRIGFSVTGSVTGGFGPRLGTDESCQGSVISQPIPIDTMNHIGRGDGHSFGDFQPGAPSYTLTKGHSHAVAQPIAFSGQMSNPQTDVDMTQTLQAKNPMAVMQPIALQDITPREKAQNGRGWNDDGTAYTVDTAATQGVAQATAAVAYNISPGKGALKDDIHVTGADSTKTLDASASNPAMHQGGTAILQAMQVRRLTPVECERLQGFPDGYTAIPWRKKPIEDCPDGPRYKALGNSMAVPVMAWIGKRIQEFEAMNAS